METLGPFCRIYRPDEPLILLSQIMADRGESEVRSLNVSNLGDNSFKAHYFKARRFVMAVSWRFARSHFFKI
jgi:hypothetical protein